MRLDRLLTLYFFDPLSGILRSSDGTRISILMYHGISERDEDVPHPYYVTNTRPEVFARQMQFLADNNYKVISLSKAVDLISGQSPSGSSPVTDAKYPTLTTSHETLNTGISSLATSHKVQATKAPRYAVITFDDGHRDYHDVAWPILKKHNFPAMMYLPTGLVSDDRKILEGRECMTWQEVVALAGEGAEFGAHTVSHVQLYELCETASQQPNLQSPHSQESTKDWTAIEYELRASKQAIEEKLVRPVDHYSYAFAFPEHDQDFVGKYETSLRNAGYRSAVSTRIGTAQEGDNVYTLKRLPMNSLDDVPLFRAKLEGAYDWMHALQFASKSLKSKRKASCQS